MAEAAKKDNGNGRRELCAIPDTPKRGIQLQLSQFLDSGFAPSARPGRQIAISAPTP
jgi:hypothetical protein